MWSSRRIWAVLLGLAGVSFIGDLFGPAGRWWGVDSGATAATVFHLALIGSAILVGFRRRDVLPETWSLAEGRAWLGLAFMTMIVLAFAKLLWNLWLLPEVPTRLSDVPAGHFLRELVLIYIVWLVISQLLGRGAGPVELDERDLRMQVRANGVGDWALVVAIFQCIMVLALFPAALLQWWLAPLILAHALIGFLIVRSLVEHVALVAGYAWARR